MEKLKGSRDCLPKIEQNRIIYIGLTELRKDDGFVCNMVDATLFFGYKEAFSLSLSVTYNKFINNAFVHK